MAALDTENRSAAVFFRPMELTRKAAVKRPGSSANVVTNVPICRNFSARADGEQTPRGPDRMGGRNRKGLGETRPLDAFGLTWVLGVRHRHAQKSR